jgi:hypothetical protein
MAETPRRPNNGRRRRRNLILPQPPQPRHSTGVVLFFPAGLGVSPGPTPKRNIPLESLWSRRLESSARSPFGCNSAGKRIVLPRRESFSSVTDTQTGGIWRHQETTARPATLCPPRPPPMLAPSAHPGGGRFLTVSLRYPRNAAPRERFAPSHRPLRAVPYGLPPAFLSFPFPFADVSGCGSVALTGSLSPAAKRSGTTRTLKGTPAGRTLTLASS